MMRNWRDNVVDLLAAIEISVLQTIDIFISKAIPAKNPFLNVKYRSPTHVASITRP